MLQFHVATLVDNDLPGLPKVWIKQLVYVVLYSLYLSNVVNSIMRCANRALV